MSYTVAVLGSDQLLADGEVPHNGSVGGEARVRAEGCTRRPTPLSRVSPPACVSGGRPPVQLVNGGRNLSRATHGVVTQRIAII